jgi:hypothetical protein
MGERRFKRFADTRPGQKNAVPVGSFARVFRTVSWSESVRCETGHLVSEGEIMASRYFVRIQSIPEHTIEFIQNKWTKTLKLIIDGKEAARASCLLPGRRRLYGTLMHNGIPRSVVATSVPDRLLWTKDTIEIDGQALPLNEKN